MVRERGGISGTKESGKSEAKPSGHTPPVVPSKTLMVTCSLMLMVVASSLATGAVPEKTSKETVAVSKPPSPSASRYTSWSGPP